VKSARSNAFLWQIRHNRQMKTKPTNANNPFARAHRMLWVVWRNFSVIFAASLAWLLLTSSAAHAGTPSANDVMEACLAQLYCGPSLVAQIRSTTHSAFGESVATGTYHKGGGQSGYQRYELQASTAGGNALLLQVNDGRLAWTRRQVGESVELRRVELSRIPNTTIHDPSAEQPRVPTRFRIYGVAELLDSAARNYQLAVKSGKLFGEPVWILSGPLREEARQRVRDVAGGKVPDDLPTEVWIALSRRAPLLAPLRIEYRAQTSADQQRVVSVVEFLEWKQVEIDDSIFHYEPAEIDVALINETDLYKVR
jgi:hypothetical protein